MPDSIEKTGLILLAAGASTRMGSPKQLLTYAGLTLLEHGIKELQGVANSRLFVVLGAHAQLTEPIVKGRKVAYGVNPGWDQGMGDSIRFGADQILLINPGLSAILIALCDQPLVNTAHYLQMIDAQRRVSKKIIAAAYADTLGSPALFDKAYFPDLLQLGGATGAKKLFQQYPHDVYAFPLPDAAWDVDTPESYENLLRKIN